MRTRVCVPLAGHVAALSAAVVLAALVPSLAGAQAAPPPIAPPPPGILPPPPPGPVAAPIFSGVGRRVVYDMGAMHVWLVEADGTVVRDYPVSGHKGRKLPGTGEFWVFSRSRHTGVANSPTRMEFMVRFAVGNTGAAIGFHSIPTKHGRPISTEAQLGKALSAGCVRQSLDNAQFLFDWAPEGTKVYVIDSSGKVPAARPRNLPKGTRPITPWERLMTTPMLLAGGAPRQ